MNSIRSRKKQLLWIILGIIIPLVVIEVGLQIYFRAFGTERQRIMYVYSPDEIRHSHWKLTALPYLNYGIAPDYPTHNSLGYRGPEFSVAKPAGVFRIVTLGGSTTYGFGIERWQDTYPARLEAILRDEYGFSQIQVINAGVEWYTSWEMLSSFAFRVLDLQPDLIILYEATNDISFRLVDTNYYTGLNAARGIWRTDYSYLGFSVLYRILAMNLGWIPNPASIENQIAPLTPIPACGLIIRDTQPFCSNLGMPPEQVLAANPPIYFERNYRNIIAMAQANRVQVMLSSWAYFPDPIEGLPYDNYLVHPFWQAAVAEHNQVVAELAAEYALPYHDLASNMLYDPAYWIDGSHMTSLGTSEQAAQYAAFIVQAGLLNGIASSR